MSHHPIDDIAESFLRRHGYDPDAVRPLERLTADDLIAAGKIDDHQLQFLRRKCFTAETVHDDPALERLKQHLLRLAGIAVVLPAVEVDMHRILNRGQLVDGSGADMQRMVTSRCHQNAANLWSINPDRYSIATGYAMSDDRIWRQHSWLYDREWAQRVVETTTPRLLYYGFALDDAESRSFASLAARA